MPILAADSRVEPPPAVDYALCAKLWVSSNDGGCTLIVSKAAALCFGRLRFRLLSGETPLNILGYNLYFESSIRFWYSLF